MDGERVAVVLGSSMGGMGRHVLSLTRGLTARGIQVDLFCPLRTEEHFEYAAAGAVVHALEIAAAAGPGDVGAMRELRRALRPAPPDVIHAHGLRAGFVAGLARPSSVPLVVTWHSSLVATGLRRVAQLGLARAVAGAADVTLCASDELVGAASRLGARDARLCMIAAPALPEPSRTRSEVMAEFGLDPSLLLILSVGRLHPYKRHDVLVAAAARWRHLRPVPAVIIAGTGPSYRDLAAQVAIARAPVILAGHRADISDLLNAADIAVITSDGEARQLFAQEALSAGVPLVSTAVGGIPEIVGDAAVLVPPGDIDAVDAAVRSLLADPSLRDAYAVAGPMQAKGWPSESDTIDQVAAVYAEIIGEPRTAGDTRDA